jgi:hypothetical protein
MPEKFEKPVQETEVAFAFAVLLLNVLILVAVGGIIWLLQSLIMLNSPLSEVLRASAWQ